MALRQGRRVHMTAHNLTTNMRGRHSTSMTRTAELPPMVNVEQMAELLGVTPSAVWARMSRNPETLPTWFRVGRRCYWSGEVVAAWIAERTSERIALTG